MRALFRLLSAGTLAATGLLGACGPTREPVDLLLTHATVYTVDSAFSKAEAFAVKDGRFVAVGRAADLRARYAPARTVDAQGGYVYPGFYDAHCHFYRYALGLPAANLVGAASWPEAVARLSRHRAQRPREAWLTGRGWDQNDWPGQRFPTRDTLDALFPQVPVLLIRIDGHAALANQRALDLAGVTAATPISGGIIGRDAQGRLTGLLVDNAVPLVADHVPEPDAAQAAALLLEAQRNCLAVGLTSLADAGLDRPDIERMAALQRAGRLHLRLYAMLNPTPENKAYYLPRGPYFSDNLTICSFKVYADGALGSRGAALLAPYTDRPHESGFLLQKPGYYRAIAQELAATRFQMNTHAIGDSANRLLLDIYGAALRGQPDRRWRIEHAQVVSARDMPKFGQYHIVPSVQPTHATSDMPWAGTRLGTTRLPTAYAYAGLLRQYGQVALGSDFPVEDINPLYGFHAAIARQDARNQPAAGFQPAGALTREQALRGMTTWAAHAAFEDKRKGQIRPGMLADFVVLDQDLMTTPKEQLRGLKVRQTWIGGQLVAGK